MTNFRIAKYISIGYLLIVGLFFFIPLTLIFSINNIIIVYYCIFKQIIFYKIKQHQNDLDLVHKVIKKQIILMKIKQIRNAY